MIKVCVSIREPTLVQYWACCPGFIPGLPVGLGDGVLRVKIGVGNAKDLCRVGSPSGHIILGTGVTKPSLVMFNFCLVSANLPYREVFPVS